jgi:hypothetical protein
MKILSVSFLSLLLLLTASSAGFGQTEKENVIAATRALESGPLDKEGSKSTERALKWLIETDEVSLIVCGGTFGLFSDKKNKQGSSMTLGYTIGMGAHKIQNPTADENAVQLAGLETALKVYEIGVKEKPKTKFEAVDALLVKRSNGELAGIVSGFDCGKK